MKTHTAGLDDDWPFSGMVTATVACMENLIRAMKASKSSSEVNSDISKGLLERRTIFQVDSFPVTQLR